MTFAEFSQSKLGLLWIGLCEIKIVKESTHPRAVTSLPRLLLEAAVSTSANRCIILRGGGGECLPAT